MAISLATDIVLDVIKAAEPTAAEAARTRLQEISVAGKVSEPFSTHLSASVAGPPEQSPDADAYKKFESLVLGSFIQNMLPEQTESVYGGGLSGDMWKSILAQHLGDALAENGGIGIANRLLADHYREGEAVVPLVGANDSTVTSERDENGALATAMVQEMQRTMTDKLFTEGSITASKANKL
jgi:Rod binding domain-containing protein